MKESLYRYIEKNTKSEAKWFPPRVKTDNFSLSHMSFNPSAYPKLPVLLRHHLSIIFNHSLLMLSGSWGPNQVLYGRFAFCQGLYLSTYCKSHCNDRSRWCLNGRGSGTWMQVMQYGPSVTGASSPAHTASPLCQLLCLTMIWNIYLDPIRHLSFKSISPSNTVSYKESDHSCCTCIPTTWNATCC
jgi:hypothetical protein